MADEKPIKLYDSELKVMEVLWDRNMATAKEIAAELREQVGWSKTTVYTVIKKLVDKGAVERCEPGFVCRAIVTREQAQSLETVELIRKMYGGRTDRLVASLIDGERLSPEEIDSLKKMVEEL